jgi:alcohol dehydrogenase
MTYGINHLTPVIFGENSSSETGAKLKQLGCKKVLCVFDKGVKGAGIVDKIIDSIQAQGIKCISFGGVVADPPDYVIEEGAEIGRKEHVDGVVGIGGGSSMDAAKMINLLLGNPSPINQYMGPGASPKPGKVLVLLPTTSGTGSEVTPIAVLTDSKQHKKGGVVGPVCRATMAIIDPVLTAGMPASVTADTGMDAFSHAAEAITSGSANPMSDLLASKAVALVTEYLPRAVKNGADMEARTNLSFAAMTAGFAFPDALTHYGHAIGHTFGALFHVPHGNACAIAIPEVMEFVADVVPEKVKLVGVSMGLSFKGTQSPTEIGAKVAAAIRKLNKEIGVKTLKNYKIPEPAMADVAKMALSDDCAGFGPKSATYDEILKMCRSAYTIA